MKTNNLYKEMHTVSIHPKTFIGQVALDVINLEKQLDFYQRILGFRLHWRQDFQAGLGAGSRDLLILKEVPGAQTFQHTTGLYHFAVLFPDQRELARIVKRLMAHKYRNYPTDHILTKTTYLEDVEGNGIELYAESPEDGIFAIENGAFIARRADGSPSNGREPLDLDALFSHLNAEDGLDDALPENTRIGHVHLHVRNLDEAVEFYNQVIGFDVMGVSPSFQAAFLSAGGGYHHHIGLNTWQGVGAPPPPEDASGLSYFSVALPDYSAYQQVLERIKAKQVPVEINGEDARLHDPSHNGILLTVNK